MELKSTITERKILLGDSKANLSRKKKNQQILRWDNKNYQVWETERSIIEKNKQVKKTMRQLSESTYACGSPKRGRKRKKPENILINNG